MTSAFQFPETFDPSDACFPSKGKPVPKQDPDTLTKTAGKDTSLPGAQAARDLDIIARVLNNHPEIRSVLFQAMEQDGAFAQIFGRSSQ